MTINTLFLDIGGVLLTNGWDHFSRERAADHFGLDYQILDERHQMTFGIYEIGKIDLHEYLDRVIFHSQRNFTHDEFIAFMKDQTKPYPDMIDYIRKIKDNNNLKTIAVSNEGRELTQFRIDEFKLDEFIDAFISSGFVHVRKPDPEIYQLAIDISNSKPNQVVYIDDRPLLIEIAERLGIRGLEHHDFTSTREALKAFGL